MPRSVTPTYERMCNHVAILGSLQQWELHEKSSLKPMLVAVPPAKITVVSLR